MARRVIGAGRLACGLARLRVVGGQEILEDEAEQLGVEGDLAVERRIFFDRELVAAAQGKEAVRVEEQAGRHVQVAALGGVVGERVDAPPAGLRHFEVVQTVEQAAVHERNRPQRRSEAVGVGQQGAVAVFAEIPVVGIVAAPGSRRFSECAFADFRVQRGEEQILEHGAVIVGPVGRMLRERAAGKVFLEHRIRCQPLFFQEPDEQQPRNQPDDVPLRGAVPGPVVREAAFCDRALEPAEQLAVETPVQFLDVECAFPCSVQVVEAVHARGGDQSGQREFGKDVGMRPMRGPVGADAFDERHFLQHVPVRIPFVHAAVDHGERHRRPVPEQDNDRHAEQAVDGAGGVGQVRAVVVAFFQTHGQEQE